MIDPADIHQLVAAAEAIAGQGVRGQDGGSVCEVVEAAQRAREIFDRLLVHGLGELDETAYTDATHGLTTAGWFARTAHVAPSVGLAHVRLARLLRSHLPATDQAWLDGIINRRHVEVLVTAANPRIRDQIAAAERDLIDLADGRVFDLWRQGVAKAVSSLDQDGPDPDDPANTRASWARSGDYARMNAQFHGEGAEILEQIIDTKIDELFHRQARDREQSTDIPALTRAQLRGRAVDELIREGHLATASDRAIKAGISLVLRKADEDPSGWPSLTDVTWSLINPTGLHLELEHFATLLCDCSIEPLLIDADDNPLKLGRAERRAQAKQRRAGVVRDGGLCVFPDCCRPGTHYHHLELWENGGLTNIENLAGLCPAHHGVTHRKGWSMHATPDQWFWWQTPSGDTFWSQRHGKQRAGPAPPARRTTVAA